MKKTIIYLLILASAFLLTGCFGSNNSSEITNVEEGFKLYENDEFSIQIPNEWETIPPLNFRTDIPKNTVVAFRNNIRNDVFTANVAVVKNELANEISTSDYAKALRQKMANELSSFREIQMGTTNITISDNPAETLYIFVEGRETPEADLKRFIQIVGVKGKTSYIAIGSFLTVPAQESEAVASKIETMIRSFVIK